MTRRNTKGPHKPILQGGPYNLHVFTTRGRLPKQFCFPAEPVLNIYGLPSISAPQPVRNGPVRYNDTGKDNFLGDPIYKFVEDPRPNSHPSHRITSGSGTP